MLGLLCICSVTSLLGLSGIGPCQAAAWLPIWWHAWVCLLRNGQHAWELIPFGGGRGDSAAVLFGLKLGNLLSFILKLSVDNAHMWEPSTNQPGWLEQI